MAIRLETRSGVGPLSARGTATPVTVLLVSPNDNDLLRLSQIFEHTNWILQRARSYAEATELLRGRPVGVLVTEAELPEGRTWLDLMEFAARSGNARIVVMASLKDDPLWAQVINLGGYDVLMKPFDRVEVVRVLSLAWMNWREATRNGSRDQGKQTAH